MGWLERLKEKLLPRRPDPLFTFHVRCQSCGEVITVRSRLSTDAIPNWDEPQSEARKILKKEILGRQCFELIYAELGLDRADNIVYANVDGGELVSGEEAAPEA